MQSDAERPDDFVEGGAATVRVACAAGNPSIAVITQDDDFVGDGAVDDANHVPEGRGHVFLLVDEVECEVRWRGPNVVFDTLVVETAAVPGLAEGGGLRTVAVQGFE